LALRLTIVLAAIGQLLVVLGIFGLLRPWLLIVLGVLILGERVHAETRRGGGISAFLRLSAPPRETVLLLPFALLAIYPPIAFDETLYHLPFVHAIASSGAINFLADLRFPIFPQLHESLCVPIFLLLGDTATHFVAVAEVVLLAGVIIEWPEKRSTGLLAAALVLGNPIVMQIGTVTYVDAALMLFVAAGAYCLDRNPAAAGFLLGTACSVKYLGWYFAAAGFVYILLFGTNGRRNVPLFASAFLLAVLPMYGRIVALTGNPFFPFLSKVFGATPWTYALPAETDRVSAALRLVWNVTFARERVGLQPPYSPLFAIAILITLIAAIRNRRAAFLAIVCVGYIIVFTFLPQDARYLLPLLPLVSVAAASAIAPLLSKKAIIAISLLAIAPGVAYAGYRLWRQGPPPLTVAQRRQYLEAHIPEFRALERRGTGRIYLCAAEQLKYFGGDESVGDVIGPYANETIFGNAKNTAGLWRALTRMKIRFLLISKRHAPVAWQQLPAAPLFERVYADDGAELWRLHPPF
jgi:4-amino-4-deoxy-L-arabinose transferase-like glycosyltransferase